jgi:hypothetical protein
MPWPERIVVAVEFILELLAAGRQADKSRVR